jgi:hypothetical protein
MTYQTRVAMFLGGSNLFSARYSEARFARRSCEPYPDQMLPHSPALIWHSDEGELPCAGYRSFSASEDLRSVVERDTHRARLSRMLIILIILLLLFGGGGYYMGPGVGYYGGGGISLILLLVILYLLFGRGRGRI